MPIEQIADYACVTGEGVIWHPQERCVYWVDIPAGRLFRYDPATGQHAQVLEGEAIGGVTVQADGALLLFRARGAVQLWRDGALTTVIDEIPAARGSRFNDVIADPAGRVFCGTMAAGDHSGHLYRLDRDGSLTVVLEDIQVPNGMGFTPDRRGMYFTDTMRRTITHYDYDEATGALTNGNSIVRVPDNESEGLPDGMTVDRDGYLWSARWDGGCAVRYAPDGTEVDRLAFPARKVASLAFGGDDYGDLYVITAGGHLKDTDGAGAGALYRLRPGVVGRPEFYSRIGL
jgi:D-xylonolactonase